MNRTTLSTFNYFAFYSFASMYIPKITLSDVSKLASTLYFFYNLLEKYICVVLRGWSHL